MTVAFPDEAAQLKVQGATNVALICELGAIGGVLGPIEDEPRSAAESYAVLQNWSYDEMVASGGDESRLLFVLVESDEALAEVVVARVQSEPVSPATTAPPSPTSGRFDVESNAWRVVAVQACDSIGQA